MVKTTNQVSYGKKPSERCLFQRQATWLKGCHYWVTLYILYFFKTLKSSQEVPFMRKRRARRKFHRNSLAGLWSKIRLKSYQQIEFASQQELHWYTMVYMIIHTHTHIYIIYIYISDHQKIHRNAKNPPCARPGGLALPGPGMAPGLAQTVPPAMPPALGVDLSKAMAAAQTATNACGDSATGDLSISGCNKILYKYGMI